MTRVRSVRRSAMEVALAVVLLATSTHAQGNYRSAALGGRSALTGDTGVALGADSAAPFLNPATIVSQVHSTLALSINFAGHVTSAPSWYVPGAVDGATHGNVPRGDAGITRISGNAIPSTLCFFLPLTRIGAAKDAEGRAGTQKLAACFGTTERDQFDWVGQGYRAASAERSVTQSSSVRHAWQRLVLSPTYAVHVTEGIALGASVQGSLTNYSAFEGAGVTTSGPSLPPASSLFETGASGSDLGLSALLGAIFTYRRFTVGATVQSPDISIYGRGSISNSSQFGGATSAFITYVGEGDFHAREPARFALGVGYRWPHGSVELDGQVALADPGALTLDTHGTQVVASGATSSASVLLETRFQPTVNASVGGEIYMSRALSMLAGVGTDLSAVDALSSTSVATTRINRVFLSFGVGSHGENGSLLVGAQGYYGFGEILAPNVFVATPTLVPTSVQAYGLMFVLSGATNVKGIENAVRTIKQAMVPSSGALHASPIVQ